MTEAYTTLNNTIKYYNYGSHIPFNFNFITTATHASDAAAFKNIIEDWMKAIPKGKVANWVVSNVIPIYFIILYHTMIRKYLTWKLFNLITYRKALLLKFFSLIEEMAIYKRQERIQIHLKLFECKNF